MFIKFTPEEAERWIEIYKGAEELGIMRPIRPSWVAYLSQEMEKGEFEPTATVALAYYRTTISVINGNHTLRAIVRSGVTIELPVVEYRCSSVQEVRDLYATFDIGKSRTRYDSFRAYDALEVLGVGEINKSDVNSLASAVQFIANGFDTRTGRDGNRLSNKDLLQEMREWAAPFGMLLSVVGKKQYKEFYNRIIKRRGVCSIAIITMRYQPDSACRFWASIATGNVTEKSPALKLMQYLLTTNVMGGGKAGVKQEYADNMARVVAYCWNKHFRNESVTALPRKSDKPIIIDGTPFDGKVKKKTEPRPVGSLVSTPAQNSL